MSRLRHYDHYDDSNIAWAPRLPKHWSEAPVRWYFKNLDGKRVPLNAAQRSEIPGGVPYWGSGGIAGHISKHLFEEPVLLVGEDGAPFFDPFRPVSFVVNGKSWINNHIHVMQGGRGVPLEWYCHAFNCVDYSQFIDGTTRDKLTQEGLKSIILPVPPPTEARAIVDAINRETARIDALIEKKTRFIELLKEKRQALIHEALIHPDTKRMRLSRCTVTPRRPVTRLGDEMYIALGLYNRGRGIFHKPATQGKDLGDSNFSWVRENDLILSGQFSWEGAVALATDEHDGCVISHRYHAYRGMPGLLDTSYLWAYFTSHEGDFVMNEHSRGSAGRNRPLNPNTLAKEKIPVPPMQLQSEVAKLVGFEQRLKKLVAKSEALLNEHRAALITAAVTGQIDLREAV